MQVNKERDISETENPDFDSRMFGFDEQCSAGMIRGGLGVHVTRDEALGGFGAEIVV